MCKEELWGDLEPNPEKLGNPPVHIFYHNDAAASLANEWCSRGPHEHFSSGAFRKPRTRLRSTQLPYVDPNDTVVLIVEPEILWVSMWTRSFWYGEEPSFSYSRLSSLSVLFGRNLHALYSSSCPGGYGVHHKL